VEAKSEQWRREGTGSCKNSQTNLDIDRPKATEQVCRIALL
jgi:hypothetical protein